MNTAADFPIASDEVEELADWLELQAILSPTQQCSRASLVRSLRRTGTTDAVVLDDDDDEHLLTDPGSVVSQGIADDAFEEIEDRALTCGNAYPFTVSEGGLRPRIAPEDSDYIFLLLLTKAGPTSGHGGTAVLFEQLCAQAAHNYFGGATNTARVLRVGAPRRRPLASLREMIDDMCVKLGEGGGCKPSKREGRNTGDGQLDIVAWREFPNDDRVGKLIAFGQCAGGSSGAWNKLNELDAAKFVKKYLRDSLVVDPLRLFFVPWRIGKKDWEDASTDSGIVFDRTRIVSCLDGLDVAVAAQRRAATATLLGAIQAALTPGSLRRKRKRSVAKSQRAMAHAGRKKQKARIGIALARGLAKRQT